MSKTEELRKDKSVTELYFAVAIKLRIADDEAGANLFEEETTKEDTKMDGPIKESAEIFPSRSCSNVHFV